MDIEKELDLKSLDRSYINSVTKKYNDFLLYSHFAFTLCSQLRCRIQLAINISYFEINCLQIVKNMLQ